MEVCLVLASLLKELWGSGSIGQFLGSFLKMAMVEWSLEKNLGLRSANFYNLLRSKYSLFDQSLPD